jgi:cation transport ATPase
MIRSRPFGNAAGSAARIAPSRRSEQPVLALLAIELSQESKTRHQKRPAETGGRNAQHIMAQTLVEEAQRKGLKLVVPGDVVETPGEGIEGLVQGHQVVVPATAS